MIQPLETPWINVDNQQPPEGKFLQGLTSDGYELIFACVRLNDEYGTILYVDSALAPTETPVMWRNSNI